MLAKLGETFKKQGWGWLWTEGTAHPSLEQVLDVGGFGYPAMTVVSAKKAKYSSLTGSFSHDGIQVKILGSKPFLGTVRATCNTLLTTLVLIGYPRTTLII